MQAPKTRKDEPDRRGPLLILAAALVLAAVAVIVENGKFTQRQAFSAFGPPEFQAEMAKRRERLGPNRPDVIVGCPLCNVIPPPAKPTAATAKPGQQQN